LEFTLIKGQVIVSHSSEVIVQDSQQQEYCCKIVKKSDRPVCGDQVIFDPETRYVHSVLPRKNVLSRPDSRGRIRPLAANIDQFIVVTAVVPTPDFNLIDRYLVAAEESRCEAIVLLNKIDLLDSNNASLPSNFEIYSQLGYPLIQTHWNDPQLEAKLLPHLKGKTSILLGQSGVGKSSLIIRLTGNSTIRTGALTPVTGAGRHTTTATTRYELPEEGYLIDSPGVRAFRLWNLTHRQLEFGFREMRPFIGACRFANCRHINEPDCAVRNAVEEGIITPERYERYQMIANSLTTPLPS
jgi:ribosome biogenesis GTPase